MVVAQIAGVATYQTLHPEDNSASLLVGDSPAVHKKLVGFVQSQAVGVADSRKAMAVKVDPY